MNDTTVVSRITAATADMTLSMYFMALLLFTKASTTGTYENEGKVESLVTQLGSLVTQLGSLVRLWVTRQTLQSLLIYLRLLLGTWRYMLDD